MDRSIQVGPVDAIAAAVARACISVQQSRYATSGYIEAASPVPGLAIGKSGSPWISSR